MLGIRLLHIIREKEEESERELERKKKKEGQRERENKMLWKLRYSLGIRLLNIKASRVMHQR